MLTYWKSCVRLKRTGGSNPLLCAKKYGYTFVYPYFFCMPNLEEDLRVGAVLREQNALPQFVYLSTISTAKDAIDNGGAGRAAKGESPVRVTSKKAQELSCAFLLNILFCPINNQC